MLATMLRADRHRVLQTSTIQEADSRLLADMSHERRYASWHVVDARGELFSAGRALTKVLSVLPAGRPLAMLTGAAPAITEHAYTWVAEHRTLLSRPISASSKQRARQLVEARRAPVPPTCSSWVDSTRRGGSRRG